MPLPWQEDPVPLRGLRIGSATAKGLGLALGKPLVHIPTVDALAYNLYGTDKIICPLMDAAEIRFVLVFTNFRETSWWRWSLRWQSASK